ncbi:ATP-binding protein [Variovorax sp. J22G73]|uniref:sensor histidine kinase n=1 Tax=unclassified Variovorax TaxID=663243 RepID=UPI002574E508|nr:MULTISPECIES: ATP-binding protein [unclassified Variovorax]MDM0010298.1 ATP-binding protein [Variovorax sp. J22R203]MDM0102658.1 ATP-binding protein [Variovorax sp. J22G73]
MRPRRLSLLALWLAMLLAGWSGLCGLSASAAVAAEAPIELRHGTVTTSVDGVLRTEPVELSYHWDRRHHGRPGMASFELPFRLDAAPETPWGIFIPRVGNVFEVQLNDALLQVYGDLSKGNGADYAKAPIYVPVPGRLLRQGDNRLQIRLRADSARRAGLSPVVIGPAAPVRTELFESAYAWRFTGSVLLTAFSLVVGGIAMGLWLTQVDAQGQGRGGARRDGIYLWVALAEFCWAARVADSAIAEPPLTWGAWGVLMAACYAGWAASAMMFCFHLSGWARNPRLQWLRWPLCAMVAGTVLASSLALQRDEPLWLTGWLAVEIVFVAGFVGAFVVATVRRPNTEQWLVAGAALVSVAFGVRDWLVIRLSDAYGETTWVRYSSVFFGVALLLIVLRRFHTATVQARGWVTALADRVTQRERELAATYAELEAAARDQARTHERERILRDMHDGVGSHISSAIRQLQSGQTSSGDLLRTLRDSLDQLKLSIDSIHLPPGDVGALLAAARYRLEPRLAAAGIALEWAVAELAPVARLDAQAMRQLQFLLFEAISNVLQHAQASVLRIEADMRGRSLVLRVIDNGRGFDAAHPPRALAERAGAIGAALALESRPGRTVVQLVFG